MMPEPGMTGENTQGRWYALYTRHQHEKVISQSLESKGFTTFLPLYAATHQWKDRAKHLTMPLFPCYVFIRCENGTDWTKVLATPGIHAMVTFAGRPAEIPGPEVEAVRRAVEGHLEIGPHPYLTCGDWVRVTSGALAGVEGYLVRKKNECRLVLSVEMLGKSAAVEVDGSAVERAVKAGEKSVVPTVNGGGAKLASGRLLGSVN